MKAVDIMTKNPVCVDASALLLDVVDSLIGQEVRHVPVVEGGSVAGILSDRDLLLYSIPPDIATEELRSPAVRNDIRVDEVMQKEVITIGPDTELGDIIDTIINGGIGALPVVEPVENQLLGIISYVDVLKAIQSEE